MHWHKNNKQSNIKTNTYVLSHYTNPHLLCLLVVKTRKKKNK